MSQRIKPDRPIWPPLPEEPIRIATDPDDQPPTGDGSEILVPVDPVPVKTAPEPGDSGHAS